MGEPIGAFKFAHEHVGSIHKNNQKMNYAWTEGLQSKPDKRTTFLLTIAQVKRIDVYSNSQEKWNMIIYE